MARPRSPKTFTRCVTPPADRSLMRRPNVVLRDLTSSRPCVTYGKNGQPRRIDCDYIAGCDGYDGVSRTPIPTGVLQTFDRGYPFGWPGIVAETPPYPDFSYSYHSRIFALPSMRNPTLI